MECTQMQMKTTELRKENCTLKGGILGANDSREKPFKRKFLIQSIRSKYE